MSGTPTEVEIQAQWKAAVDCLESVRNFADGTMADASGKLDTLLQSLEGEYTPIDLANFAQILRSGLSDLVTPQLASQMMVPILFEYAKRIDLDATGVEGFGSGYTTPADIFRALYEYMHASGTYVTTRGITYDTSATTTGNTGNGAMSRLTVDENGYDLEACHVEKKRFRCRADQNTGTFENAEVFEVLGESQSPDALLRGNFGSGSLSNLTVVSKNAGTGNGGSLLSNSSFSEFESSNSPQFSNWTETAAPANSLAQDTTNFYRSFPGAQTDASLRLNGGLGDITLKQTLTNMRIRKLDPNTPYQFRIMANKTVGTASGGTLTIRMGSLELDTAISALSSGWQEVVFTFDENLWPRTFNEDPFDLEIEWASSTSGYLLIDDAIFAPLELIDGTWWWLRGNAASHTPWLLDDNLVFEDTNGAPGTGKLQYWCWIAGFGYLPNSGSTQITDP